MVLQNALQLLRCDTTEATGFAPAELMIGRKLVYPIEFSTSETDLSGTTMTVPLVKKLMEIRKQNFKTATKKIKKAQRRYKKNYDKKMNAKPFRIKIGDKVQYKRHKSKSPLTSTQELSLWCPIRTYHLVLAVYFKKQQVLLQDKNGNVLQKTQPFSRIRKFKK